MKEIWKDIEGYEGLYQVSNLGRVRGLDRVVVCKNGVTLPFRGVILKQQTNRTGYKNVVLSKQKKPVCKEVHRLVALAFVENPHNKPQVNHIDFCRTNNVATNLEFVTSKENHKHAFEVGKRIGSCTGKKGKHSHSNKPVLQFSKDGKFLNRYFSMVEAQNKTGVDNSDISAVCRGKNKTAGGYKWEYATTSNNNL
jgi:hypothetical protein